MMISIMNKIITLMMMMILRDCYGQLIVGKKKIQLEEINKKLTEPAQNQDYDYNHNDDNDTVDDEKNNKDDKLSTFE